MILDEDLSEGELHLLAHRSCEQRRAVARHPNANLRTLLLLAKDGFAQEVDQNPMLLLHIEAGSDEVIKILENIAKQTQQGERLTELASLIWNDVRRGVADNKSTPPATLSLLAKDQDDEVRGRVARNPRTPPEILSLLAKDKYWYVISAARATLTKLGKEF